MFFCEKFSWTVAEVYSHTRSDLEAIMAVLEKRKRDASVGDAAVMDEMERRNIKKLQGMKN